MWVWFLYGIAGYWKRETWAGTSVYLHDAVMQRKALNRGCTMPLDSSCRSWLSFWSFVTQSGVFSCSNCLLVIPPPITVSHLVWLQYGIQSFTSFCPRDLIINPRHTGVGKLQLSLIIPVRFLNFVKYSKCITRFQAYKEMSVKGQIWTGWNQGEWAFFLCFCGVNLER